MIVHHPGCTADYPEKPTGEAPQAIVTIPIDHGERVQQCSDCGAFELLDFTGRPPTKRAYYEVSIYKGGRLYDWQVHEAEGFSISTYISEMLSHGYGLDVTMEEA